MVAAGGVPPVKGIDAPIPTDSIQGAASTGAHLDTLNTSAVDTDVAMKPAAETATAQKQGNAVAGGGAESTATGQMREEKAASPVLPTVSWETAAECERWRSARAHVNRS